MENSTTLQLDREITRQSIQDLNNADHIAGFFSYLGYNTNPRITQTLANLGISAQSLIHQIKCIELIASSGGPLPLQVYLFELASLSLANKQALARVFKNKVGNFLLVLTKDYERIDFVLVDRKPPTSTQEEKGIKGVGDPEIQNPRVLAAERRYPSSVHLRVLRRFTYTEGDPIAQYQKLRQAYSIAYWSENFFNNKALFSDYYLKERLKYYQEWTEDPKSSYLKLRELYEKAPVLWGNAREAELRKGLLEPIFQVLGFSFKPGKSPTSEGHQPDYRLYNQDDKSGKPLAICLSYKWDRFLDGKDSKDPDTPDENPSHLVTSLLGRGEAEWAIVTNGRQWRLYWAKAHSRYTNYYEISDLKEVIDMEDTAEAFRYFYLFFRRQAFQPRLKEAKEGEKPPVFLDFLLKECDDFAKELGERLKGRVFKEIFPLLAEGFIENMREKRGELFDLSDEDLDCVKQATLTFLYRVLFILYAEALDLLPLRESFEYSEKSLDGIKKEIARAAGGIKDEIHSKLRKQYKKSSTQLYRNLMELFQIIDKGEPDCNLPTYNGGLFITDIDDGDDSYEAANARFLLQHEIPDYYLAPAIDLVARDEDPKTLSRVFIDYKALDVQRLGSIYEGLLEFFVRIAEQKMAVCKGKRTEEIMPYQEAVRARSKILTEGRGKNAKERTIPKGTVYIENDRKERKATGSYYTPDYIVDYIVKNTVGPVLDKKLKGLEAKLRQLEKEYRQAVKRAEECKRIGLPASNPEKVWNNELSQEVVEKLFDIKVLDPAMGSGHFLVNAVDYITDRLIVFLQGFPENPVNARLEQLRNDILTEMKKQGVNIDEERLTDTNLLKRHVLKRCIYGVDLNPMAVELAKVSLWLDCFTLGAPLSFLDHHLKCGNSLIGSIVEEVREAIETKEKETIALFGSQFAGLMLATDLMRRVGVLSDVTVEQVKESQREYRKALNALAPFKRILDVYTSQWFGNNPYKVGSGKKSQIIIPAVEFLRNMESEKWIKDPARIDETSDFGKKVVETTLSAAKENRFFHWELEFPEVFFKPRYGTTQAIERMEGAGFDAVIGNPPYDVTKEDNYFRKLQSAGCGNLFGHFIVRGAYLTGENGAFSYIIPLSFACGEKFEIVRRYIYERFGHLSSTHYSKRPAMIFSDVQQRITIFIASQRGNQPCEVESSRLYRFHEGEQASVVLNSLTGKVGPLENGFIPRVADNAGASIYHKLKNISGKISDLIVRDESQEVIRWWFHSVGQYWLKAYNFIPYFIRNGKPGLSTKLVEMKCLSDEASIACISAINSNIFYFWWILQSDEFDLLRSEILSFPLPLSLLEEPALRPALNALMNDYQEKAIRKTIRIGSSVIEMDEIHARNSRELIIGIDKILAPHYGLNDEELEFLIKYDESFRCAEEEVE